MRRAGPIKKPNPKMTNMLSQRLKTKKKFLLIRHSRIESVPIPLLDINYAGSKATLLLLSCYLALLVDI